MVRLTSIATTVSLLAMSVCMAPAGASAATASHIAKWVPKATKVGAENTSKIVKLSAFLGFRHEDELTRLIAAQGTRGAPEYGHYLSAPAFRARFAPSAEDAARVESALSALGFTVGSKPASNLYVEFSGTVAQVKAAFQVSQNLYAFQGKVMRANAEEPTLPSSLRGLVAAIGGLDETGQLIHPFHHSINEESSDAKAAPAAKTVSPSVTIPVAAGLPSPYCSTYFGDTVGTLSTQPGPYAAKVPWLVCSYTPQQMRAAYGVDKTTIDGTGITVAITDAYASPSLQYDANRYSTNHSLPKLVAGGNFVQIYNGNLAKVSDSDPCQPQGWFGEISLDVDAVHTMAPGANILYSGGLSCSNADLDAAIYTVVDGTATVAGPLADIITNSWGETGEQSSPAEQAVDMAIFEQAAAEGVSIVFSSGDNGDVALLTGGYANASWPAASPLVTSVGGTSLGLLDASGNKSEWGWGTFRAYLSKAKVKSATSIKDSGLGSFAFYAGAGGGPSFYWLEPSYQAGIVPTALTKSTYNLAGKHGSLQGDRVGPDVAMDADPYTGFLIGETYTIAGDPFNDAGCTPRSATLEYCENGIGGTSLASPLFAGSLALVDQLRRANGLPNLGFANPKLYGLTVGAPGSTTTPLVDVQPPAAPTAMLRGYANDLTRIRLITVNSVPGPFGPLCKSSLCEGQDSWTLETKRGYDDVTGLGTPYIPALLATLGSEP